MMGTRMGKKNYFEIVITNLNLDLETQVTVVAARDALIADPSTVFFGRLVDGGHGLKASASLKWTRDGEADWSGLPEGTAALEAIAVGYDEVGDNAEYTKLNLIEGERMYAYQVESINGLCKKAGPMPIYVDEDSTGNIAEAFTVKGSETGEKESLWQRFQLPLVAP